MDRQYYLDLAAAGLRLPVGADLVLRERSDPESVLTDGERLGGVVAEAAARYGIPLAMPVMDLMLEKAAMLEMLGIPAADIPTYHFAAPPGPEVLRAVQEGCAGDPHPRLRAQVGSVRYIATATDLLPIGMAIGPFSLLTKLIADPITPVFLAGSGVTAADDPEVALLDEVLELASLVVLHSVRAQMAAGARAVFIAEPAANRVYFSPRQVGAGEGVFERYGLAGCRRVKQELDAHGVDLLFHCCGELTDDMVRKFCTLDPAVLSLGSSRVLWDDAALVPRTTVLFGNLPTKRFYSDDLITVDEVCAMAGELLQRMEDVGHPYILGSECDVLSVPGCHETICGKVQAFLSFGRN